MVRTLPPALALLLACGLAGAAGAHGEDPGDPPPPSGEALSDVACHHGWAGPYPCRNVHLSAFVPFDEVGHGQPNDVWGWADPDTGREYALLGLRHGVAFFDLGDPTNPHYVGFLPTQTTGSLWRDVKVYDHFALVVSQAGNHGLQVFDLQRLADVTAPPETFAPDAHYAGFGKAHNVAVDEATAYAFVVGGDTCNAGLHFVDLMDPLAPVGAGCFSQDGYSHDVQCVVYAGPDEEHRGREICLASNEDTLTIVDVSDKAAPVMLSRTTYDGVGYVHQGWLTEDHAHFLLGDELDERNSGHGTRTWVWDVSDLDAPVLTGHHTTTSSAIDHNLHIRGRHVHQANYTSGLRVLRLGDLSRAELAEVAFLDTHPDDDDPVFEGVWGVYPYLPSGLVLLSDMEQGLFVVRPDLSAVGACEDGIDNDGDGATDWDGSPADPQCNGPADAEQDRVCGLGFELAALLPILGRLRRRARRRAAR